MKEPLQQRANERKIYEEIVSIIVNYVNNEFNNNESARLRIYTLIADNFDGMVRALTPPPTYKKQTSKNNGDIEDE